MAQPPNSTYHEELREANPEARFLSRWLTGVRRDGFLTLLGPAAWHTLSALLSFTSRDGSRRFSADQLAATIGQPRAEALRRLEVLSGTQWHGQPLVVLERDPSGEVSGARVALIERLTIDTPPIPDHDTPAAELAPELLQELARVGLNHAQIDSLAKRFPAEEIEQQLQWLPARGARNPAALLIRAIEQGWDEPKEVV